MRVVDILAQPGPLSVSRTTGIGKCVTEKCRQQSCPSLAPLLRLKGMKCYIKNKVLFNILLPVKSAIGVDRHLALHFHLQKTGKKRINL